MAFRQQVVGVDHLTAEVKAVLNEPSSSFHRCEVESVPASPPASQYGLDGSLAAQGHDASRSNLPVQDSRATRRKSCIKAWQKSGSPRLVKASCIGNSEGCSSSGSGATAPASTPTASPEALRRFASQHKGLAESKSWNGGPTLTPSPTMSKSGEVQRRKKKSSLAWSLVPPPANVLRVCEVS